MLGKITKLGKLDKDGYEGFVVWTENNKTAFVPITNYQSCCESFGTVVVDDDNLSYFIGAELLGVDVVKENMAKEIVGDTYDGGAVFVDFKTSLGTIQAAVYNNHNGYYGHDVEVRVGDKLILETYI